MRGCHGIAPTHSFRYDAPQRRDKAQRHKGQVQGSSALRQSSRYKAPQHGDKAHRHKGQVQGSSARAPRPTSKARSRHEGLRKRSYLSGRPRARLRLAVMYGPRLAPSWPPGLRFCGGPWSAAGEGRGAAVGAASTWRPSVSRSVSRLAAGAAGAASARRLAVIWSTFGAKLTSRLPLCRGIERCGRNKGWRSYRRSKSAHLGCLQDLNSLAANFRCQSAKSAGSILP